jgi:6,7-dimethyl-8-ribityllumazine synthase
VSSAGCRDAIVAARFNDAIVARLIAGALEALAATGHTEDVPIHRVPGAFELPLGARGLASTRRWDAIVALGCVIRGETAHFDHVGRVAADGLARVALDYGTPVGFGVLTTGNTEQALARAGGEHGNLGFDAAVAAVSMAATLRTLG